ncbi:hypothetical protein KAR91_87820 [Candidatus Pacearchaeota archaeon]|nr:hypothetical protein [Candidatus Pacearchaeota archaeon]
MTTEARRPGIIFAEDDADLYRATDKFLSMTYGETHEIEGYRSGDDIHRRLASEVENSTGLAVVLTDNIMPPGPTGMEITEEYAPKLPCAQHILYSGDKISEEDVLAIGGCASIRKPARLAILKGALDSALVKAEALRSK